MGNCQAVDNASFVLQTQNGQAGRFYSPVSAAEIMKLSPGHCVALLLTTTFYSSPPSSSSSGLNQQQQQHQQQKEEQKHPNNNPTNTSQQPLRVTRIKLLRPTDNLVFGNAYRLITNQEVMKGLKAKKKGKLNNIKNFQPLESTGNGNEANSDSETRSNQLMKTHHQMRKSSGKQRCKTAVPVNNKSAGSKPRGWYPSLNSISEATS